MTAGFVQQYSRIQQLQCGTTPRVVASDSPHGHSSRVGVAVYVCVHISNFVVIVRVPVNNVCIAGVILVDKMNEVGTQDPGEHVCNIGHAGIASIAFVNAHVQHS